MDDSLSSKRLFLLDMDGTFYLGEKLIPGSLEFIETVCQQGKDYLFLTNNSSKAGKQYAEKISRLGLPITESKVITSGEATALYLAEQSPGASVYLVGTPALEEVFLQHGFHLTEDHPDLVVLGFDTSFTYQKLWRLCDFVRAGLPYIATHPDFNCPVESGFMPDIGATIAFVKASTGRDPDRIIGKPNEIMIDVIAQKTKVDKAEMVMIGDRLYTDIAMGKTVGLYTILVLSGETSRQDLNGSPYQPNMIFDNLGKVAEFLQASNNKEKS